MDFSSAYISMQMGHLVQRSHWDESQYWCISDGVVYRCGFKPMDVIEKVTSTSDLFENVSCKDWEIVDGNGVSVEPGGRNYDSHVKYYRNKVAKYNADGGN